ncbi:endonuclease/exonuclease/phosphatase family protein [Streptomyces sp. CRN 30]|uniref:endonuclease/exonuclease/phosphatase family protein n=1 Tax=Streptomyces sp. CRN 30 TaxID=3075613 RepID=UPI002A81E2B8|nr:endonuclease/exonuclease/phosphatase family protein [Streptomyces sp. CRN 30]
MRVVTWNLWWRFGPWAERQKAVLAVLGELRPDVVGLQEVWAADDGGNLAEWLAGELGLHWTWAAYRAPERWQRRIDDRRVTIGAAVLSRWPVAGRAVLRLPAPAALDDGRVALYAGLDAPGGRLDFVTAHLTSASTASAVRCAQTDALAGFAARHRHRHGTAYPPVLTGDFNAGPASAELRRLAARGWTDAWDGAAPDAPAATWDPANPYVTGAGPAERIDHIRLGPDTPVRVRSAHRAGDAPVDGVWPSDHYAVVADLDGP